MQKFLLFPLLLLIHSGLFCQHMSFYRENITMRIDNGYFYVSGQYYVNSDKPGKQVLFYPFPGGELYGDVDSVHMYDITNEQALEITRSGSSRILFLVDFSRTNDIALQISYRQKLLGKQAEYILETTQLWRRPLEEAHYQLIVPASCKITAFSIPPGDSILLERERIYTWDRFNYMPTRNLVFEFTE